MGDLDSTCLSAIALKPVTRKQMHPLIVWVAQEPEFQPNTIHIEVSLGV